MTPPSSLIVNPAKYLNGACLCPTLEGRTLEDSLYLLFFSQVNTSKPLALSAICTKILYSSRPAGNVHICPPASSLQGIPQESCQSGR